MSDKVAIDLNRDDRFHQRGQPERENAGSRANFEKQIVGLRRDCLDDLVCPRRLQKMLANRLRSDTGRTTPSFRGRVALDFYSADTSCVSHSSRTAQISQSGFGWQRAAEGSRSDNIAPIGRRRGGGQLCSTRRIVGARDATDGDAQDSADPRQSGYTEGVSEDDVRRFPAESGQLDNASSVAGTLRHAARRGTNIPIATWPESEELSRVFAAKLVGRRYRGAARRDICEESGVTALTPRQHAPTGGRDSTKRRLELISVCVGMLA